MVMMQPVIDGLIAERIALLQRRLDLQLEKMRPHRELIDKVMSWTEVPDDIDDDTLVAVLMFLDLKKGKERYLYFTDEFLSDLHERFMPRLLNIDAEGAAELEKRVRKELKAIEHHYEQGEFLMELVVVPPKGENQEWTGIVIPLIIDGNRVEMAHDLDIDVGYRLMVFPPETWTKVPSWRSVPARQRQMPGMPKPPKITMSYQMVSCPAMNAENRAARLESFTARPGTVAMPYRVDIPLTNGDAKGRTGGSPRPAAPSPS